MPLLLYCRERDPVPILQEAGWASVPIWMGPENIDSTGLEHQTVQPVAIHYNDYAILSASRYYTAYIIRQWILFNIPLVKHRSPYECGSELVIHCRFTVDMLEWEWQHLPVSALRVTIDTVTEYCMSLN
jgi:hypothetical protein